MTTVGRSWLRNYESSIVTTCTNPRLRCHFRRRPDHGGAGLPDAAADLAEACRKKPRGNGRDDCRWRPRFAAGTDRDTDQMPVQIHSGSLLLSWDVLTLWDTA